MPVRVLTSPLPATVKRPSTKSVGALDSGSGSGSHRSRFGLGSISSNGVDRRCLLSIRLKGGWFAARKDPVHPGAPVDRARLGEGGAADLLGVQAERGLLR